MIIHPLPRLKDYSMPSIVNTTGKEMKVERIEDGTLSIDLGLQESIQEVVIISFYLISV